MLVLTFQYTDQTGHDGAVGLSEAQQHKVLDESLLHTLLVQSPPTGAGLSIGGEYGRAGGTGEAGRCDRSSFMQSSVQKIK